MASSGTRPKMQPKSSVKVADVAKSPKIDPQEVPNKICQYCKLEFTQKQLDSHEDYCGSRTEQCKCTYNKYRRIFKNDF